MFPPDSWVNFYGNIGKTLLSLVRKIQSPHLFLDSSSDCSCNNSLNIFVQISIFFDILFMFQHYVLYPEKKSPKSPETGEESNEPLIDPSHEHV